jgi:predicted DNA-binding transcriptional regulator AlpA
MWANDLRIIGPFFLETEVFMDARVDCLDEIEVSRILGVAAQTLRNWRCQGRGPTYVRLGRSIRYLRTDLDRYIDSQRVAPDEPRSRKRQSCEVS